MTVTNYKMSLLKEVSANKKRLVEMEKAQGGGTVMVTLKTDKIELMYRRGRKPEPFYLSGVICGVPQILNVSEL